MAAGTLFPVTLAGNFPDDFFFSSENTDLIKRAGREMTWSLVRVFSGKLVMPFIQLTCIIYVVLCLYLKVKM